MHPQARPLMLKHLSSRYAVAVTKDGTRLLLDTCLGKFHVSVHYFYEEEEQITTVIVLTTNMHKNDARLIKITAYVFSYVKFSWIQLTLKIYYH